METGTTARREWSTIFKQLRYDSKMVSIRMIRFELVRIKGLISGFVYLKALEKLFYIFSRCEDQAEIIWANRQQIRQLEMIQEGLNIPPQVG